MRLTVSSVLFLTAVLYLPTGQGRKIYSKLLPIEKKLVDLAINNANQNHNFGHLNFYEIVDIRQFTPKQVTTLLGLRVTTCKKAPRPEHRHRPECPFKRLEVRCFVCTSQSNPKPYIDCVRRKDVTKTHHDKWDQKCQLSGRLSLLNTNQITNQINITILFKDLVCYSGDGRGYQGTVARTISGKTCQRWSAQTPQTHDRTPENYPCKGLDSNYCRNPDNERMPWCYTTDSQTRWEYCNVSSCGGASEPELTCYTGIGTNYQGMVARTVSGKTCQSWSSQSPHEHERVPEDYPDKGLDSNYCRNPDEEGVPWCYTTDRKTRWENCDIPSCDSLTEPEPAIVPELNCFTCEGINYRGTVAKTISGKTCQGWSAQTPHSHERRPENNPHSGLDDNYCRNPDSARMPWCYTTDSQTRWEFCQVPRCAPEPAQFSQCGQLAPFRGCTLFGGIESKLGDHPWQASLQSRTTGSSNPFKHACGGVLIASCWVLTAAHCFNNTVSKDMQVVLGGVDITTHKAPAQVIPVERVIVHNDYRESSYALHSDIALLRLKATDSPLCAKETNYVKTACLPDQLFPDGKECVVSGWGQTENRHRPNKLSKAVVPLISKNRCMAPDVYGNRMDDTMICAGYMEGEVDACKGDSGGPLMCREKGVHYVAGLVSWTHGCGLKNKPGLYTNVYNYTDWITRMISPDASDYPVYDYSDYENDFIEIQ